MHQELSEQLLRIHQAEDRTAFHGGRSLRMLDAANRKVAKSKHRENNMSVRVMNVEEAQSFIPAPWTKAENHKEASQGVSVRCSPPPSFCTPEVCSCFDYPGSSTGSCVGTLMPTGLGSAERWQACTGRYRCRRRTARRSECDGTTADLIVPRFACCLRGRLPTLRTRAQGDNRDPMRADQRFLRACGKRPPDMRDGHFARRGEAL